MPTLYSLTDLKAAYQRKEKLKYLYFWGHTPKHKNETAKAVFSQWYPAPFEIDGISYATAEHYMMAEKAKLFGTDDIRRQIIASAHPKQAKDLGRQVIGFKNDIWNAHRVRYRLRRQPCQIHPTPRFETLSGWHRQPHPSRSQPG